MKFSGVCLVTASVPRLVEFYQQVLGSPAEGDHFHAEFSLPGGGLAIFSTEGMEQMAPGSMRQAGYGGVTLTFEVADVDAEYQRIQTLEVEFVKLPETHPWGSRSFWFRDPDGNIIDFYSRVGASLAS